MTESYLRRTYGLTLKRYTNMMVAQDGRCAVCRRQFGPHLRANVDHRHVPGYKKLLPEEKKKYVRGILCFQCNKFKVGRHTTATAKQIYDYLRKAEK
jgi:hypothetical protein